MRMPQRTISPNSAMCATSSASVAPTAASAAARRQASGTKISAKNTMAV